MAADALAVSGDQATDGTVTVTVTENGSAVANASVTVEALNNSTYVGSGDYVTDENGTVGLAAPEQNVSVSVTASANNATASTTLDLVAPTEETNETEENDSAELDTFGAQVSSFVASLQDEGNMSGQTVAAFVVGNNPGADERPDHVDPGPNDDGDEGDEADANGENDGQANGNSGNGNGNGGSNSGNGGNGNSGGNNGNAGGNGNGNAGGNGNGPP